MATLPRKYEANGEEARARLPERARQLHAPRGKQPIGSDGDSPGCGGPRGRAGRRGSKDGRDEQRGMGHGRRAPLKRPHAAPSIAPRA